MKELSAESVYHELKIVATSPNTEIWLGDDEGYFVVKEVGTLRERLMPGDYTVEFGLGSTCYPIALQENSELTQDDLESGPSCKRPAVIIPDEDISDSRP